VYSLRSDPDHTKFGELGQLPHKTQATRGCQS
jgi:hypothetical protein